MLCGLMEPFDDSFACMQEWELNTHTNQHVVRLDFLHKIAMSPSTRYESPAFFQKYRAATLGGHNYAIRKEVQRYHSVDEFFSDSDMYRILSEFNFFATARDESLQPAFKQLEDSPSMQPRVRIEEMTTESIPTAILSAEALETIHEMRHNRYLRRNEGKRFTSKVSFLIIILASALHQPGHQLNASEDQPVSMYSFPIPSSPITI